ncbi:MOSC domain-containing protein [Gemmata sp. JC673]|uniref:MOSC domain-containing protein n=1 Tax=Gemmata algarum TaxID=2975278 RepID=A0ABU5F3Q1_9BACT|nr:MOSC domain-containing protein [Gemmata algarum]MDY3561377.1 MOSC domain-containing protein [Gemmata algarum]
MGTTLRPAVLTSVQVGRPRQHGDADATDPLDRLWTSGFYKDPVAGPVRIGVTNIDGDGQADLVHHGGPDKAVCVYPADHYPYWREALNRPDLPPGAFGENFTVEGLTEAGVCVGDVWTVGGVALQVSQPRQPCWKLARRWRVKTLTLQVQQTGRTGWYFRVLREGVVTPGEQLALVERPHPEWTVERANTVMHHNKADLQAAAELGSLPQLSASWRETLTRRVTQGTSPDQSKRLNGPLGD